MEVEIVADLSTALEDSDDDDVSIHGAERGDGVYIWTPELGAQRLKNERFKFTG